jgi:predicted nucleic acid-binding protein
MKRIVVDASVMIKWILGDKQEADQEKAFALLQAWVHGRAEISAPFLWQYEVGNFLGREIPDEAEEKMKLLLNLNIANIGLSEIIYRQCFLWMREDNITFYDACYLAAAHANNADLITADVRFAVKMGKRGRICLLKDLDIVNGP